MAEIDAGGAQATVRCTHQPDGTLVFAISGELDTSNVDAVGEAINHDISGTAEKIAFELADMSFMDSSGIALLLKVARRAEVAEVHNPSPIVRRIIEVTGVDEILRLPS